MSFEAETFRIIRFALVGVIATLVHLGTSLFFVSFTQLGIQTANVMGFGSALFVSYAGHYFVSFQSQQKHQVATVRFLTVAGLAFAANVGLVQVLGGYSGLPDTVRLVIGVGIMPAVTYILHRFWVF